MPIEIGGTPRELRAELAARSALYWADQLPDTTALLLIHGTADWRVSPSQSLAMAGRLLDTDIPFELHLVEGLGHDLWQWPEARTRIRRWFDRLLKREASAGSTEGARLH